jgi:hypothetical protein
MALARVVTFDNVDSNRMNELRQQIESGSPPEGLNPQEMLVLHDSGENKALVVVVFANEDDYRRGDEVLSAMPAGDTPGQRTSVGKYDVAIHMTM